MRRFGLLLCLLLTAPCWGRPAKTVPLDVSGDVTTVVVVNALPLKITAPPGAAFYFWNVPAGLRATHSRTSNVCTVTAGPKGQYSVTVETFTIDFKAQKVTTDEGSTTFSLGEGPVPPPPPPDTGLSKALADALAADRDADKAALANKLGRLYRTAAATTVADTGLKTVADIDAVVRAAAQASIGLLPVPNLRDAAGAWLKTQAPTSGTLDDAARGKIKASFLALADALEGLKGVMP